MGVEDDRKLYIESFPGKKCFQTFDDIDKRKSKKLIFQSFTDENQYPWNVDETISSIPVDLIIALEERNEWSAGVHFAINEPGINRRRIKDIIRVRAVFADFDGEPLPSSFDERPSMIIETSPGKYHVYWLAVLKGERSIIPLQSFKPLQKSIAEKFNSDPAVTDLSRCARCPGFFHSKKERFISRIIDYTGYRFEYSKLVEMFPPLPVEQWSAPKYQHNTNFGEDTEFKGDYGASEGGRNHHVMSRIGGMMNAGKSWAHIEKEAYMEGSACNPPLPPSEVRDILRSARRYM